VADLQNEDHARHRRGCRRRCGNPPPGNARSWPAGLWVACPGCEGLPRRRPAHV